MMPPQDTLFPLPPVHKPKRPPPPDNQVTKCKRCWGSKMAQGTQTAYCHRMDLCLYYEDGYAKLEKDDRAIVCDGVDWRYLDSGKDD